MIWRERRVLLGILALLLAANTIFFFTYRVRYEQRLRDLDARIAESQGRLEQARQARMLAERQFASYQRVQRDINEVYNERWSTQGARLVPMILEVKRLATASQLVPPSYSFTQSDTKADLTGALATDVVGISFGVQGTYQQVRRMINLLELSSQFVIIDQISLAAANSADAMLSLTIHVKTLFRDTNPQRGTAAVPASQPL